MAVHCDLAFILVDTPVKNVHYFHHMLKSGGCHIFPTLIFESNSILKEGLRIITEPIV